MELNHPREEDDKSTDTLIGVAVAHDESYGDARYSLLCISRKYITVYDKDGDFKYCINNTNILSMYYVDDNYIYCILRDPMKKATKADAIKFEKDTTKLLEGYNV